MGYVQAATALFGLYDNRRKSRQAKRRAALDREEAETRNRRQDEDAEAERKILEQEKASIYGARRRRTRGLTAYSARRRA